MDIASVGSRFLVMRAYVHVCTDKFTVLLIDVCVRKDMGCRYYITGFNENQDILNVNGGI